MRLLTFAVPSIALAATLTASPLAAQVYVDASNDCTAVACDGVSWTTAFDDLQDGLTAAAANPGPDVLHVAEGVYTPHPTDRSVSFVVPAGTVIYGGYPAGGGPRNATPGDGVTDTVLSGDLAGDDAAPFANRADNSLHVVLVPASPAASADPTSPAYTRLDGLSVTAGYADTTPLSAGGGAYVHGGAPVFSRVHFTDNAAAPTSSSAKAYGGAVYINRGEPVFSRVLFQGNTTAPTGKTSARSYGGAVYVNRSAPTFINVVFAGNSAVGYCDEAFWGYGGAVYVSDGTPTFTNTTFTANIVATTSDEGPAWTSGGAIYMTGIPSSSFVSINNSTFSENFVFTTTNGFAYNPSGSAIYASVDAILKNVVVWNSSSGGPDVIESSFADVTIDHALIRGGCPSGATCANVLTGDPLFTDHDGADGLVGTPDDDLTLQGGSPAINAGSSLLLALDTADLDDDGDTAEPLSLDLMGHVRVAGASVELGAYEFGSAPPAVACTASAPLIISAVDPADHTTLSNTSAVVSADLTGCTVAAFDGLTEQVTATAGPTAAVAASTSYDVSLAAPAGPGAVVVSTAPLSTGSTVGDVVGTLVAAVVYDGTGAVFGECGNGPTGVNGDPLNACGSAQGQASVAAAMAALFGGATAGEGSGAVDLSVVAAPNPVSGAGSVSFGLAEGADVTVALFDALGRQVALLAEGPYGPGRHSVALNAASLPSGVYVVRIVGGGEARPVQLTVTR